MTRKQFYKDLSKATKALKLQWSTEYGIRSFRDGWEEFCPITAVATFHDYTCEDGAPFDSADFTEAAYKLGLRNSAVIADAADSDYQKFIDNFHEDYHHPLSHYKLRQSIRKELLKAVGLS